MFCCCAAATAAAAAAEYWSVDICEEPLPYSERKLINWFVATQRHDTKSVKAHTKV
jgi:hypothetical protein